MIIVVISLLNPITMFNLGDYEMIEFFEEWGLLLFSLIVFIHVVLKLAVEFQRSRRPHAYKPNSEVEALLKHKP